MVPVMAVSDLVAAQRAICGPTPLETFSNRLQPGRASSTSQRRTVYAEAAGRQEKRKEPAPCILGGRSPSVNRNAAGIDVRNAEHYVAVPAGRDPEPMRKFGSFTADLHRVAQWLKACGIKTVVMQATGVYWVALYQILEGNGFQANVVNARRTKTLPGRKTDVLECQ
jgi:hypothetical protein